MQSMTYTGVVQSAVALQSYQAAPAVRGGGTLLQHLAPASVSVPKPAEVPSVFIPLKLEVLEWFKK